MSNKINPAKPVKAVSYYNFQRLEGKMLTIIEGIGLNGRQEEAIKSIVRNTLWESWESEMAWMPNQLVEKLNEVKFIHFEGEKIESAEESGEK